MKTSNIELKNQELEITYESNLDKITNLLNQYDFYYAMIDDYSRYERVVENNESILNSLKKLSVSSLNVYDIRFDLRSSLI